MKVANGNAMGQSDQHPPTTPQCTSTHHQHPPAHLEARTDGEVITSYFDFALEGVE